MDGSATADGRGPDRRGARAIWLAAIACLVLAALSAGVVAPAPGYDPWSWAIWGREVAHGTLSTAEGPAFKPLPVGVCALLAPLGEAAPVIWVVVARAAALAAVVLAFRLARRLAGGSWAAGALAAAAVALSATWADLAAAGAAEGLLVAVALAAAEAWRAGRAHLALAAALGCALVRVEAWPFAIAFGVLLWRRRAVDRRMLLLSAAAVPALWFGPELAGSGELLRSAGRAQVPNPGQPALAAVPAWASLREAAQLPLWPVWGGLAALAAHAAHATRQPDARARLVPGAAGLAWICLVAAMAQAGFSGEERYAVPGVALLCISAAVGLAGVARARHSAAVLVVVALAAAAWPRVQHLGALRERQAHQWALAEELPAAIAAAGGRDAVLRCGRPSVGPYRGPLLAWGLRVEKRLVTFAPRAPGVAFRSRLHPEAPLRPGQPGGFAALGRAGPWRVAGTC